MIPQYYFHLDHFKSFIMFYVDLSYNLEVQIDPLILVLKLLPNVSQVYPMVYPWVSEFQKKKKSTIF